MSFRTLKQEERDEWRGNAVTKEAIALIREQGQLAAQKALMYIREDKPITAATHAGTEEALRIVASILEND